MANPPAGIIMLLTAVVLPIAVILSAGLMSLGTMTFQRAAMRRTVEISAQAGASVIRDLIVEKIKSHDLGQISTDPLASLTSSDRNAIINDPRIETTAEFYIKENWTQIPRDTTYDIVSPAEQPNRASLVNCDGGPDQKNIELTVMLSAPPQTLFPQIFEPSGLNTTEIKYVKICP